MGKRAYLIYRISHLLSTHHHHRPRCIIETRAPNTRNLTNPITMQIAQRKPQNENKDSKLRQIKQCPSEKFPF